MLSIKIKELLKKLVVVSLCAIIALVGMSLKFRPTVNAKTPCDPIRIEHKLIKHRDNVVKYLEGILESNSDEILKEPIYTETTTSTHTGDVGYSSRHWYKPFKTEYDCKVYLQTLRRVKFTVDKYGMVTCHIPRSTNDLKVEMKPTTNSDTEWKDFLKIKGQVPWMINNAEIDQANSAGFNVSMRLRDNTDGIKDKVCETLMNRIHKVLQKNDVKEIIKYKTLVKYDNNGNEWE